MNKPKRSVPVAEDDPRLEEWRGPLVRGLFLWRCPCLPFWIPSPYPGNVPELRNAVECAVNICQNERIGPEHLAACLTVPQPTAEPAGVVKPVAPAGNPTGRKTSVLPHASPEELCHLILAQDVRTVVRGAIEEEYYQCLTWKK